VRRRELAQPTLDHVVERLARGDRGVRPLAIPRSARPTRRELHDRRTVVAAPRTDRSPALDLAAGEQCAVAAIRRERPVRATVDESAAHPDAAAAMARDPHPDRRAGAPEALAAHAAVVVLLSHELEPVGHAVIARRRRA
jgi:hypothetical protein